MPLTGYSKYQLCERSSIRMMGILAFSMTSGGRIISGFSYFMQR